VNIRVAETQPSGETKGKKILVGGVGVELNSTPDTYWRMDWRLFRFQRGEKEGGGGRVSFPSLYLEGDINGASRGMTRRPEGKVRGRSKAYLLTDSLLQGGRR